MVIVPYDPKTTPSTQQPEQLYLPYERFLKLWEAAKETKRPPAAVDAPVDYSLSSARYEAQLGERALTITGRLELFAGRDWTQVPLTFGDAKLSSLTVDGRPALWSNGELTVEKAGRHVLQVTLELSRPPGSTEFHWLIPRSTATLLALTLPQAEMTATITPGSGAVERVEGKTRIVTAALGSTPMIHLSLHTAEKAAATGVPVSAAIRETAKLTTTSEEYEGRVEFAFPSAVQDHFTVLLDSSLTLAALSAPNLKSWTLRPQGGQQALELLLHEPAKNKFAIDLVGQRLPAASAEPRAVPLFSAQAGRVEWAAVSVVAPERTTVALSPAGSLRQIPASGAPEGWRVAGVFAGTGTLQYQLSASPSRREAQIDYLYQVGRRQLELFAALELTGNGDPLTTIRLELPPGFEVETLQSARAHSWWRSEGSLIVTFPTGSPSTTQILLHLVQKAPDAAAALELRSLQLADFHKVESTVAVAAHQGVEAALTRPPLATEVPADKAAESFQVLPPLERKHGFQVPRGDFTAQVRLVPIAPRVEALWALRAEAHESWAGLSAAVQLQVRQGSVESTRFALPAVLPEGRVAGEEVREARSHVEGDLRIYDVSFQNEIAKSVELTIDLEVPHTGQIDLPALTFPGLARATGYLLVENASEGEMRLANQGLDSATAAELPWPIPSAERSQLFRVPTTAWSSRVTVERLEKATGRLAFCPWAEFATAFRRDGTEWHKAVWHVQNRALQFLPVRLPPGAELVSARVAGQSVRADTGSVEGAAAVLIPLIKTRPGDLSYDVELVYRRQPGALSGKANRGLDDPDLVGITVERTFWKLWAPQGYELQPTGGNMEVILPEVASADKMDSLLQEMKSLGSIIRMSSSRLSERRTAWDNYNRLQGELAKENREQEGTLYDRVAPAPTPGAAAPQKAARPAKGDAAKQSQYVQDKMAEMKKELAEQAQPADFLAQAGAIASPAATSTSTRERAAVDKERGPGMEQRRAGWTLNGAVANSTSQTQDVAGGRNIALNDNIVFNTKEGDDRRYDDDRPREAGESSMGKAVGAGTGSFFGKRTAKTSATPALLAEAEQPLSAARANRLTMSSGGEQRAANDKQEALRRQAEEAAGFALDAPSPAAAMRPLVQAATPPAAPPIARAAPVLIPGLEAVPDQVGATGAASDPLLAGAAGGRARAPSTPAAAAPPPPLPQQDHRITLAVDFPTEGEPIYFKKLKSAANLQVRLTLQDRLPRGRHAVILLGVLALLAYGQHRSRRVVRPLRNS